MRFLKAVSLILVAVFMLSLSACGKVDKNYGVEESVDDEVSSVVSTTQESAKITSLDNKMSKFFDITLFDEENYSEVYLGEDFALKATFDGTAFSLPTTMEELGKDGWELVDGSDYDKNSLIYAKETVELVFVNGKGTKITALFYNSLNTSVRISKCSIVKFRISNGFVKDTSKYPEFNINGITNTSVVTDIIQILGTPSHFYKKTENSYYFDYFFAESDRRNKIRVYVDLNDDAVTAVEFSDYKS